MCRLLSIFICCLALILSGCSRDTPEAALDNYLYRLSNTLGLSQPPSYKPTARMQFPLKRERILQTTEIREGLIDVLKLKRCNLLPLIAERNSSLGKVATPSTKLVYELKFFFLLSTCQKSIEQDLDVDLELKQQINEILQIKRANLPAELWNGIYASKAMELNFSKAQTPLPLIDNGSSQQSIEALQTLVNLTSLSLLELGNSEQNSNHLNTAFNILYSNRSGPYILSSIEMLTYYLNQTAELLDERHSSNRPICRNQEPSPKAKILENVFYKFYIGEILPYMAQSHRYGAQWLDLNSQLLQNYQTLSVAIPKGMETYSIAVLSKTSPNSLWYKYLQARDKHTAAWQKTLKQCGLMPTQRN